MFDNEKKEASESAGRVITVGNTSQQTCLVRSLYNQVASTINANLFVRDFLRLRRGSAKALFAQHFVIKVWKLSLG
jgi:hypothetical protein